MNLIIFILLINYGNLAHLQGYYYPKDDIHYRFKVCDENNSRYAVTYENVLKLKDYLEKEHKTELNVLSTPSIEIYSSVIRESGLFHELAIITIKTDDDLYYIEVVYRKLKE